MKDEEKFDDAPQEKTEVVDECECEECLNEHHCNCGNGEECCCDGECECGDDCQCGDDCKCHHSDEKEHHHKEHGCHCEEEHCCCEEMDCHSGEAGQYLLMAQRLQADFDNYRKRVAEQLDLQREEGKKSVIEVFLPCLDTFKEAKKSITDEGVLAGVNMIESKILTALKTLNVEKTPSVGQKFNHNYHEVIAVLRDESKENDVVLDEYQAGYTMNGKVIRYSKVIVNKLD